MSTFLNTNNPGVLDSFDWWKGGGSFRQVRSDVQSLAKQYGIDTVEKSRAFWYDIASLMPTVEEVERLLPAHD